MDPPVVIQVRFVHYATMPMMKSSTAYFWFGVIEEEDVRRMYGEQYCWNSSLRRKGGKGKSERKNILVEGEEEEAELRGKEKDGCQTVPWE